MEERKGFGSNFGFLMAAVGSAVGLGNIWGFPNKMGASGGALFLILYLVLAVLCDASFSSHNAIFFINLLEPIFHQYLARTYAREIGRASCRERV